MNLTSHQVFMWFTTPKELREIADKMEKEYPTRRAGQTNVHYQVFGKSETLQILADQGRMSK